MDREIYKKAIELQDNGIYDLQEYVDIGAIFVIEDTQRIGGILESVRIKTDDIGNRTIEEYIEYLTEFIVQYEELNAIGKSEISADFNGLGDRCYSYNYWIVSGN